MNTKFSWAFNFLATFNNVSVISWQSDLLVKENNRVPGENHQPAASY
jgi:hypothetical protein